ncbi:unnamed protein product [Mycena citricolor]|uniref:Uncharacterized protein n=1 Tax=Mycena citricolor TaxID=2018698 RepID=A0AAD2HTY8_9AGAR|nr:unnamed protein product [Mycena citricolor]
MIMGLLQNVSARPLAAMAVDSANSGWTVDGNNYGWHVDGNNYGWIIRGGSLQQS